MPTVKVDHETAEDVKAFNAGCDARVQGVPMWKNPHDKLSLATWWQKGWEHVHKNWASSVDGRWFPRLLPHAQDPDREHVTVKEGGTYDVPTAVD
jgi:hypothetical protein